MGGDRSCSAGQRLPGSSVGWQFRLLLVLCSPSVNPPALPNSPARYRLPIERRPEYVSRLLMRADSSFHSQLMRVRCPGGVVGGLQGGQCWISTVQAPASLANVDQLPARVPCMPLTCPVLRPPLPPAAQVPEDLLSTEFKKGLGLPVDGDAFDAAEDEQGSGPRRGAGTAAAGGQAWAGGRVGFTPEHLRELLKRRDITFTKSAFE